ncbi:MAG: molybdenum cofactor biosynthesis protein MoaE [Leptospirales bacterium]|nr:molybdenum cofactor biosynthesis protein MoaE [Leptospirales bacterium]
MRIASTPLDLADAIRQVEDPAAGAIVQFLGTVRNTNQGRSVIGLEYEAHEPLANSLIEEILSTAISRFDLLRAYCCHRIGKLAIGETAVLVLTSSMHRREAYQANEYILNRVKHEVPIWKKEYYPDGSSEWSAQCAGCASLEHHPGG